ncbi:MAG: hypothetical protein JSU73_01025, partial [candidate division WOR-3 bacterium]
RLEAAAGRARAGATLRLSARPESGWAVDIVGVDGRLVRKLGCTSTSLFWNGRDASGSTVEAGVYLCLLTDSHGSRLAQAKLALPK